MKALIKKLFKRRECEVDIPDQIVAHYKGLGGRGWHYKIK